YLKIVVIDDGKGINPEIIRKKLRENGIPEERIETEDQKVIQHIFDHDFSTAEKITLTSGRGVGMGVVKEVVEKLGGVIVVNSEMNVGTQTQIMVPFN